MRICEDRDCRNCIQLLSSDSDLEKKVVEKITAAVPHAEEDFISIQHITKIDHCPSENWNLIKEFFRSSLNSCIFLQVPSGIRSLERDTKHIHMEAYRIKMKYQLLVKCHSPDMESRLLGDLYSHSRKFKFADDWHKCAFVCKKETDKMKSEMVWKEISLYDFVLQDEPETKISLRRQKKHLELVQKFPNYGEIIASALERAYKLRMQQLKEMQEIRMFTRKDDGQEITLDYGSVNTLANYLNGSEIQNLVKIFK